MTRHSFAVTALTSVVALFTLTNCSMKVENKTAYKGRLKVEQKLDVAQVKTPTLEIQLVSSDAKLAMFQDELKKSLPTAVPATTQFKKVMLTTTEGRSTASQGPVLKVTLQKYDEPGFMNQYNGELVALLEFWNGGKLMGRATAIGTTKHDSSTMGIGAVSWKTSGKEPPPVWTSSARIANFTMAFLTGSDSQVEGALF